MTQSPHSIGRRWFLKQLGVAIALSMTGLRPALRAVDMPAPVNKPNILFIFSEDLFQKEAITFISENKDVPFFLYESDAHISAKRQQAQTTGQMQDPVKANTLYKGRSDEE